MAHHQINHSSQTAQFTGVANQPSFLENRETGETEPVVNQDDELESYRQQAAATYDERE